MAFKTAVGGCCCINCATVDACLDDAELELTFQGLSDLGACVGCDNINGVPILVNHNLTGGDMDESCIWSNGFGDTVPFTGNSCTGGEIVTFQWRVEKRTSGGIEYWSIAFSFLTASNWYIFGYNLIPSSASADTNGAQSALALAAIAKLCSGQVAEDIPFVEDGFGGAPLCGTMGATVSVEKTP